MRAAVAVAYDRLLDGFGILAGATIAALALLVSIDVVIRNIGIGNLPWVLEVTEYALYVSTFLAAPWVLRLGSHVRVDVLVNALPTAAARATNAAADVIGLAASAILLYYGLKATLASYADGSLIFKEVVVTEWYLLAAMPISAAFLIVEFVRRLVRPGARADDHIDPLTKGF